MVCFPGSAVDVATAVAIAARHGRPFVARGSGTGLAGGATPIGGAVVVVTTHLNRVLEVDPVNRVAWVEPGVLNLDLSRSVRHLGLHYGCGMHLAAAGVEVRHPAELLAAALDEGEEHVT